MVDIGFVGARGMVGSVLVSRMQQENDFKSNDYTFYSTSQAGKEAPQYAGKNKLLLDAFDIDALSKQKIILSCQGGDYTKEVYPKLRAKGWDGYWVDAASANRMDKDSVIVLSPINGRQIDQALEQGVLNFIGGNCTVSLLLMAMNKLIELDLVEWATVMSYQAYSGAGAKAMKEFVEQMCKLGTSLNKIDSRPIAQWDVLKLDETVSSIMRSAEFSEAYGMPLAANLAPWIDSKMPELGQTREEWKAAVEAAKITGRESNPLPIDGICVRVGAMRCHSQAVTLQLKEEISDKELERLLQQSSAFTKVIENEPEPTKQHLTPAAVSGTLDIRVGRVRHLHGVKSRRYGFFTVGDQLLWGAAEPLRCALNQILVYLN